MMYALPVFIQIARGLTESVQDTMENSPEIWGGNPDIGFVMEADLALDNVQCDADILSWVGKYGDQLGLSRQELEDVCLV